MIGVLALIAAVAGSAWLLWRAADGDGFQTGSRQVTVLKAVIWLGLVAALFAARLQPFALMVLVAAGGVTAIELWRGRRIEDEARENAPTPTPAKKMSEDEALSVLGLGPGADAEAVRAAHRKLISQLHPDKGGTDYLAAKINEARDYLLTRLGEDR